TTRCSTAGRSTASTTPPTSPTWPPSPDGRLSGGLVPSPLGRCGAMTDEHEYSVSTARAAAERDQLTEWVAEFLASPGSDNAALAEKLSEPPRLWIGPLRLRIDRLHRLAGPPDAPVLCPVDDDYWRDDVAEMAEQIDEEGWEPPP